MAPKRTDRLNSLLQEVISEVIRRDVKNPHVNELISVTKVDITKDLRHAKVYISVIGDDHTKQETLIGLQSAAGFIGTRASKKMVIRYFPELTFKLDETVDQQMRVDSILKELKKERELRQEADDGNLIDQ